MSIIYSSGRSSWHWAPATGLSSTSGILDTINRSAITAVTTYTITGVDSFLMDTTTFFLTVAPLGNPGTISGSPMVCAGYPTLWSDSVSGGAWASADSGVATVNSLGLVTGVAAGIDTIFYYVSAACANVRTFALITVAPLPLPATITGVDSLCVGDTSTLFTSAATGTWSGSNSALVTITSSGLATGVAAGAATISYSVTNSCGTFATTHEIFIKTHADCTLGFTKTGSTSEQGVEIYPNPTTGLPQLTLTDAASRPDSIVISDVTGRKVLHQWYQHPENRMELNISKLAAGMYIYIIYTAGNVYVGKILLEK